MTKEPVRQSKPLRMTTLGELLKRDWPAREDIIGPWLRDGESAMLWAPPGLGKSMLALTLALMVAGSGAVCGWSAPKPRPVLYVDGEMHVQDVRDRLVMLLPTVEGIDQDAAMKNLTLLVRQDQHADAAFPDLATPGGQDEVLKNAKSVKAALVILDNFATLAEVKDENDASAMTPVLTFLLRLKQAKRAALLIHHSGKTESTYRGSSKLATTFEVIIGLQRLDECSLNPGTGFELRWDKFRGKRTATTRDMKVTLEDGFGADAPPRWLHGPVESTEAAALLDELRSCKHGSQRELADAIGMTEYKVSRLKARLIRLGESNGPEWKECLRGSADGGSEDFLRGPSALPDEPN